MKRALVAAAIAAGLLLPGLAAAQRVGLVGRAGTLGLGGELSVDANRRLGVRIGLGAIPLKPKGTAGDVDFTIKPPSPLTNFGVDLYPMRGHFRLSGGLLLKHDISMTATTTATYDVNGTRYTGAQVGTIDASVKYGSAAPYATFGWSGRGKGVGVTFDLGAAFLGQPTFRLSSTGGSLSQDPTFQANLQAEQVKAQNDAARYMKVLPILSLGLRVGI